MRIAVILLAGLGPSLSISNWTSSHAWETFGYQRRDCRRNGANLRKCVRAACAGQSSCFRFACWVALVLAQRGRHV
jgi:hypothetical protein